MRKSISIISFLLILLLTFSTTVSISSSTQEITPKLLYQFEGDIRGIFLGKLGPDTETMIVLLYKINYTSGRVVILDTNGSVQRTELLSYNPGTMLVNDVNDDYYKEIIIGAKVTESTVYVYYYNLTVYWSDTLGNWVDALLVNDINNDGNKEVVASTWGNTKAWLYNGTVLWNFNNTSHSTSFLSSGDVNGDGYNDVIVSTAILDSKVYVLNGNNGTLIWNTTSYNSAVIGIAINADNDPESELAIFVVNGSSLYSLNITKIAVVDNDGSLLWSKDVNYTGILLGRSDHYTSFNKGYDVDNDGIDELLLYNESTFVSIDSSTGNIEKLFHATNGAFIDGDIYRDGNSYDVVLATNTSNLIMLNLNTGSSKTYLVNITNENITKVYYYGEPILILTEDTAGTYKLYIAILSSPVGGYIVDYKTYIETDESSLYIRFVALGIISLVLITAYRKIRKSSS